MNPPNKKSLHEIFTLGIIIKGIDGIFQIIAGLTLLIAKSDSISKFIQTIFQHEITQDPTDFIANYFLHLSQNLSISTISFLAVYLIINGSIKLILSSSLWFKKLWAYPLAAILLSLFVIYQITKFIATNSAILLILILLDISIIILLRFEYNKTKSSLIRSQ